MNEELKQNIIDLINDSWLRPFEQFKTKYKDKFDDDIYTIVLNVLNTMDEDSKKTIELMYGLNNNSIKLPQYKLKENESIYDIDFYGYNGRVFKSINKDDNKYNITTITLKPYEKISINQLANFKKIEKNTAKSKIAKAKYNFYTKFKYYEIMYGKNPDLDIYAYYLFANNSKTRRILYHIDNSLTFSQLLNFKDYLKVDKRQDKFKNYESFVKVVEDLGFKDCPFVKEYYWALKTKDNVAKQSIKSWINSNWEKIIENNKIWKKDNIVATEIERVTYHIFPLNDITMSLAKVSNNEESNYCVFIESLDVNDNNIFDDEKIKNLNGIVKEYGIDDLFNNFYLDSYADGIKKQAILYVGLFMQMIYNDIRIYKKKYY